MTEQQNTNPTGNNNTIEDLSKVDTTTKLFKAKEYFKAFFLDVIDLDKGVDKRAVITEIKAKNSMSGANAWMLMCSIVIASIGLDLDSQAVIIGAMLISPLMSPILGIGLSVGVNDMNTLKKSLSHFAIAIVIALVTSTVYFYLSPFDQITPQIKARTEPTFLDVLIAFFGGIAGIVSYARKDISTTIPGVAIATALMPPLCVTGFGLANAADWHVALSSFYLFFVNTFFVALATFLIVRLLGFPTNSYVDKKTAKRNVMYIAIFSIVVTIPSFFIFKKVLNRVSTEIKIQRFVEEGLAEDMIYLDDYQYVVTDTSKTILLKVYGDKINESRNGELQSKLQELGLKNTSLQIIPTSEINLDRINELESDINGVQQMASKLTIVQQQKADKDQVIKLLESELSTMRLDSTEFSKLCQELKALHADIVAVDYAAGQSYDYTTYQKSRPIVVVQWNPSTRNKKEKHTQIEQFLAVRFGQADIRVIHR